jgi:triosephosphate isomerase
MTMNNILVAANWKMNGSKSFVSDFIRDIVTNYNQDQYHKILICPPFPYLDQVSKELSQKDVKIGAQDIAQFENGPYTGEVSAEMLSDNDCDYVLVGHSERRTILGEKDDVISGKFNMAIKKNLVPILCIGETLDQKENSLTEEIINSQMTTITESIDLDKNSKFIIAYEPLWAIGSGLSATPEDAQNVHEFIRSLIKKISKELAESTQILYGGSVNINNAKNLFSMPDINGGLIGGASLDSSDFLAIAKQ